ncbi:MAG: WD40 repeat domain-containing protein, partial [Chloroflexaceae bacterium]|nr:WD40 repeat domain-containing protein [Chloroflexaceae bacterium]
MQVSALAYSPDGQQAVSGSWYGEVRVWDVTSTVTRYAVLDVPWRLRIAIESVAFKARMGGWC